VVSLTLGIPERGAVNRDGMAKMPETTEQGIDHQRVAEEVGPLVVY
jgi:hypothetical protein